MIFYKTYYCISFKPFSIRQVYIINMKVIICHQLFVILWSYLCCSQVVSCHYSFKIVSWDKTSKILQINWFKFKPSFVKPDGQIGNGISFDVSFIYIFDDKMGHILCLKMFHNVLLQIICSIEKIFQLVIHQNIL